MCMRATTKNDADTLSDSLDPSQQIRRGAAAAHAVRRSTTQSTESNVFFVSPSGMSTASPLLRMAFITLANGCPSAANIARRFDFLGGFE